MQDASRIREHMEVVGSDGGHVGTVDKVEGDRIKLTKKDDPDGSGAHHHFLPLGAVSAVAEGRVELNMPAEQAKRTATGGAGEVPEVLSVGFDVTDPAAVDALTVPADVVLVDLTDRLPGGLLGALALRGR